MSTATPPPPSPPIAEDELHAFLDGELGDPARRAAVERHLADDPGDAARVRAYAAQSEGLRRALAGKAAEPVPARLDVRRLAAQARSSRRAAGAGPRRGLLAASIAAGLLVGAGGGWTARGLLPAGGPPAAPVGVAALPGEVAAAYRLYALDPARPVEMTADRPAVLAGWLSDRLGRPVPLPDLGARGYRLIGGRVLPSPGHGPAALLVYEGGDGRLTVYLRAMADPRETTPMRHAEMAPVDAWSWADKGLGFSVAAREEPGALKATADALRAQLDSI